MAILEFKNLSFTYPNQTKKALENVNLEIKSGEFVVVCGESGCGKSTLLKMLKKQLQPKGTVEGQILYNGIEIKDLDERQSVTDIGYVMQNPDNQIVTDKVWHELAFGLEGLGEETSEIRRKVAEICGFFGIGDWYLKKTNELSGGQKQLLNLASITVMQPKVLVLDEPTSQLDPIAAADFIATLQKINEELGVTIILVEHRLEEVFPIAHKVVLMDKSKILMVDTPRAVGNNLKKVSPNHKMLYALPSSVRIFNGLEEDGNAPLTVREGKDFVEARYDNRCGGYKVEDEDYSRREKAIEIKEGFFKYERNSHDVLKGIDLTVYSNEILCILGGNGAGKTTLFKVLSGVKRLYRGKLKIWGKKLKEYNGSTLYRNNLACLPQNPQLIFSKNKVIDDLYEVTKVMEYTKERADKEVKNIVEALGLNELTESHPFDLSGGEQQKVAIAKILLMHPKIILLDEPTKGMDASAKRNLASILNKLKDEGKTIVIVTHDIEFAAEYSDRCGMFFDGQIVSTANPVKFFATNCFYTTAASRISRGIYRNAVTVDMVVDLCKRNGLKEEIKEENGQEID